MCKIRGVDEKIRANLMDGWEWSYGAPDKLAGDQVDENTDTVRLEQNDRFLQAMSSIPFSLIKMVLYCDQNFTEFCASGFNWQ